MFVKRKEYICNISFRDYTNGFTYIISSGNINVYKENWIIYFCDKRKYDKVTIINLTYII